MLDSRPRRPDQVSHDAAPDRSRTAPERPVCHHARGRTARPCRLSVAGTWPWAVAGLLAHVDW
jgi:hypothetical protein